MDDPVQNMTRLLDDTMYIETPSITKNSDSDAGTKEEKDPVSNTGTKEEKDPVSDAGLKDATGLQNDTCSHGKSLTKHFQDNISLKSANYPPRPKQVLSKNPKKCANPVCQKKRNHNQPYCASCIQSLPLCANVQCQYKTHAPFRFCLRCYKAKKESRPKNRNLCSMGGCLEDTTIEGLCHTCYISAGKKPCKNKTCNVQTTRRNQICDECFFEKRFNCMTCNEPVSQPPYCWKCIQEYKKHLRAHVRD